MSDIVTLSRLIAPPNGALVQKAHSGVVVVLMVPPRIAERIAIRDGEPADELHLTLAYLGQAADLVDEQRRELHETLHLIASIFAPLTGHLNGAGRFCNDDDEGDPFFVIPDLPALPALRQMVVGDLKWGDVPVSTDHGFVPHITLKHVLHDEPNPFDQIERQPIQFDALTLMMAGERTDYMFTGHVGLEQKSGARHSRKEFKALNRIVDLAMQLGGQVKLEEKAGSRHSRRDRGLIQEIHDISKADLGAVCKSDKTDPQLLPRMTPPLLELSSTLVKQAQRDAPNYQPASTVRTCNNCLFSSRVKSGEWCGRFEFVFADSYVCDDWAARSPDNETPGLANIQKVLGLLQIIKGGPTSGNFGHKSVKGKHGGSKPGGGHKRIGIRAGDPPSRKSKQVGKHRKAKGGGVDSFEEALGEIFGTAKVETKDTKPVTPSGSKKMSDSVDLSKVPKGGKIGPPIRDTLDLIDSVHGDGKLDSDVPFKIASGGSTHGKYSYWSDQSREVMVSRKSNMPMMTTAHEMGHMLDHKGLTGAASAKHASEAFGKQKTAPQMQALKKAIDDSDAIKDLSATRNKTVNGTYTKPNGTAGTFFYKADTKYIDYLTNEPEKFARAYSQYIATKTGNAQMKAELDNIRADSKKGKINYKRQWEDKDFEPIAKAFDELLTAEGYLE